MQNNKHSLLDWGATSYIVTQSPPITLCITVTQDRWQNKDFTLLSKSTLYLLVFFKASTDLIQACLKKWCRRSTTITNLARGGNLSEKLMEMLDLQGFVPVVSYSLAGRHSVRPTLKGRSVCICAFAVGKLTSQKLSQLPTSCRSPLEDILGSPLQHGMMAAVC